MSISLVHEEIERFLTDTVPEVLCISGKWGVGKTFAWNHYINEVSGDKKLGLKKYSYVSLFGLRTIDELRSALFENSVDEDDIISGPDFKTLRGGFDWVKKGFGLAKNSTLLNQYVGGLEKVVFLGVKNQIVCIDDLVRAGSELKALDVLGLVSFLKELRGCKVVLLLNKDELKEEDKNTFGKQLEKVVDTELEFSPSPSEAAEIVFPDKTGINTLIHKNCVALGITNIRVIKKIERNCLRLEEILSKKYPDLIEQALHSATLFGWVKFQSDQAPSLDFIKEYSPAYGIIKQGEKISPKEQEWHSILSSYGFMNLDEFDAVILRGIFSAPINTKELKEQAERLHNQKTKHDKDASFRGAWDLYHDSFSDNENEVLDSLFQESMDVVEVISPGNLSSVVIFLKEFKRKQQAKELIKYYVETRKSEIKLFDLEHSAFDRDLNDPDILAAFKKVRDSYQDTRDPGDVLDDIAVNRGWNGEDILLLSKLKEKDFYKLFKNASGTHLHRIIRGAIQFGTLSDATGEMHKIFANATAALKKIATESQINKRRVQTQGVKI